MKIDLAHLREKSTSGGWINFAIFAAKPTSGNDAEVLASLTRKARMSGLKIDQSALAFKQGGQTRFYGDKNLVNYLSRRGVPRWTHKIDA